MSRRSREIEPKQRITSEELYDPEVPTSEVETRRTSSIADIAKAKVRSGRVLTKAVLAPRAPTLARPERPSREVKEEKRAVATTSGRRVEKVEVVSPSVTSIEESEYDNALY